MLRSIPSARLLLLIGLILCWFDAASQPVYWTGAAGTGLWSDAGNWSAGVVPGPSAVVTLDNRAVPGAYRVQLPDVPVTLLSVAVRPSPGISVELFLPPGDTSKDALVLTGGGYALLLGPGAVFRNASGVASGASINLTDSMRIENGGRYIHSTRGTHAASLLAKLSTAPGTELGIFEFDVPRASYTISVSNRIYGTLALRAAAYGLPVNYTCSGSNPLLVRGNLDLGINVSLSVDLAGENGNISVLGDLLQQPGTLNLGSGEGDSTLLRLQGRFVQEEGAVLTSSSMAFPRLEFSGNSRQILSAAGAITGNTSVRVRNAAGVLLDHALTLPYGLVLLDGPVITTTEKLLTLGPACVLAADSTLAGTFIDGPLRRQLNPGTLAALFPVGANGTQRWLMLKEAAGDFTAVYFPENPMSLGSETGAGIDHISSLEYWTLRTSGTATGKVELSHRVPQSGSITDPSVLRVTQLLGTAWKDAGESGFTGDLLQGSVISFPVTDFTGSHFTLGSALALDNPLPLETVVLKVQRKDGRIQFQWNFDGAEQPAAYDLMRIADGNATRVFHTEADKNRVHYGWSIPDTAVTGPGYHWRVDLVDGRGNRRPGRSVWLPALPVAIPALYVVHAQPGSELKMILLTSRAGACDYTLYSLKGERIAQGYWSYGPGKNQKVLLLPVLPKGVYVLRVRFNGGGEETLRLWW